MAVTQAQIDALSTALHQGTLQVRHGETTIIYRSFAEIKATLDMMKAELAGRKQRPSTAKNWPWLNRDLWTKARSWICQLVMKNPT